MLKERSRRVGMCWHAYNRFRSIFRSKRGIENYIKLWRSVVLSVLTYGCETWLQSEEVLNKVRVSKKAGLKLPEEKSN